MAKINELVAAWRDTDPVTWAQSQYGWVGTEGQPVALTAWQSAVLTAWWQNRADVSTLAISNTKKTGKTFLNAVLTAWRWLSLPGLHFAVGNDLDQSTGRQFYEIAEMTRRHPFLADLVRVTGKILTFEPTGSQLVALPLDAAGNAGANHLTASHTEAWGILSEAGVRAYEELTPPPGRFYGLPALRVLDSYAGFDGQSTTWHKLVDRGLTGKRLAGDWPIYREGGLLLFHMEGEAAQGLCYRGDPADAEAYYEEQRMTLRPNAYARMHLNQRVSGESAFLPEGAWEGCLDATLKPLQPGDRRRLVFGADASTSRDLTALVGVEYDQRAEVYRVAYVKVWKPQRGLFRAGRPTIDLDATIGAEILRLHKAGNVAAVIADPYQLHAILIGFERAGIKTIELPQTSGRVEADSSLFDAITGGQLKHYGDPVLDEHIRNAVALETPRGMRLAKERTSLKIDGAVSLSMALWGARKLLTRRGPAVSLAPNPWDCAGDFNSDYLYYPDGTYSYCEGGVNKQPHPAGVTWHNCPHRRRGCQPCVAEMDADGTFWEQKQRDQEMMEQVEMGTFRQQAEQRQQDQLEQQNHIDQRMAKDADLLRKFWNSARRGQS